MSELPETCEETVIYETKRLHDIQVLMQSLVIIFGSTDYLNSLALYDIFPMNIQS